jgi:glutamate dehydrogenase
MSARKTPEARDTPRQVGQPNRVDESWLQAVRHAAHEHGPLLEQLAGALPPGYDEQNSPEVAALDIGAIDELVSSEHAVTTRIVVVDGATRFRVYVRGTTLALADLLPMLDQLGVRALDERAFTIQLAEHVVSLHDVGVELPPDLVVTDELTTKLQQAFAAEHGGAVETDGLNRLVLLAGLSVQDVAVLRAYTRYLRQIAFPFTQTSIEQTLSRYPNIAALLVEQFANRFRPGADSSSVATGPTVTDRIGEALAAVPGIDDDRTLRTLSALIDATTRTNAYRPVDETAAASVEPGARPVLAFKFDTSKVPDLPLPKPMFEIWVYSPRVEGVHLRNGRIARGGIRWSDRRDDFRTEVLGLVKAQIVKNAVIVPTGAKGGFVVKRPPAEADAFRAEGVACYREFISGLLDLTDNIVDGVVVPPPHTRRHDGDDPYLVVAADKGTATFSDIANEIGGSYQFWLGDAFASGGSVGYDHKAMGITARGAWESVRRHARSIGRDADRDELTVVGVGDMSGDVFGNGLLRSAHLKLLAAFDHRHIFIDPNPDPASSFAERERLFQLARSSWADYDATTLSDGGGIYPRSQKSIDISKAAAARLATDGRTSFTPTELISAILRAPVDLLWNGGVGTYVKAATESNSDVGDRANDSLRVNGGELRCKMVAEGGNLGFTQRGRVEFALTGGLINTDAIDNSAGVDCSDHEVNLKILFGPLLASGVVTGEARDQLLAEMTDEVADLVLDDNRAQTLTLAIARRQAHPMVNVHARYVQALEEEGWLNRALEYMPTERQMAERQAAGQGLTIPEFAVLMAYTKSANYAEMIRSDLPDDPYLLPDLVRYFPAAVRQRFGAHIRTHRLAREIVGTQVVNQMVNLSGISFDHRVSEDTGAGVVDVIRGWVAARDIFGFAGLWDEVDGVDPSVKGDVQLQLFLECRRMVERGVLWLMRHRRPPITLAQVVGEFRQPLADYGARLEHLLRGRLRDEVFAAEASHLAAGVPEALAQKSVGWPLLHTGFDVAELAAARGLDIDTVGATYWHVFDALDLGWLWDAVGALPRGDRWQTQARASLRDDLLAALAELTDDALHQGGVDGWAATNDKLVTRTSEMLTDIRRGGAFDVTTVSVAVRQLRNLSLVTQRT